MNSTNEINKLCSLKGYTELVEILKMMTKSKNLNFMQNDYQQGLKALLHSNMYVDLYEILELSFIFKKHIDENILISIIVALPSNLQKKLICSLLINNIQLQPFFYGKLINNLLIDDQVKTAITIFYLLNFNNNDSFLPNTSLLVEKSCLNNQNYEFFISQFKENYLNKKEYQPIKEIAEVEAEDKKDFQEEESISDYSMSQFDIEKFVDNLEINFSKSYIEEESQTTQFDNSVFEDDKESVDFDEIKTIITKYTKVNNTLSNIDSSKNKKLETLICNSLIFEFANRIYDNRNYEDIAILIINSNNLIKDTVLSQFIINHCLSMKTNITKVFDFLLLINNSLTLAILQNLLEEYNKIKNYYFIFKLSKFLIKNEFEINKLDLSYSLYESSIEYIIENESSIY